jgi:hypothetical protein
MIRWEILEELIRDLPKMKRAVTESYSPYLFLVPKGRAVRFKKLEPS